MSSIGVGSGYGWQRLLRVVGWSAVGVVFAFGLMCNIASFSGYSSRVVEEKYSRVNDLRFRHKLAMDKVGAAKTKAEQDQAMKELMTIETELTQAEQEFEAARQEAKPQTPGPETAACFPAEMKVLTAEGAKSIRDIRVGDRVLTADEAGQKSFQPVLKTLADRNNHYYLINGAVKVTALHRIATAEGWKKARELEVGDRIRDAGGGLVAVESITRVETELPVYNLTVAENHNFYVTPDGEGGYLVHNCGGGGK